MQRHATKTRGVQNEPTASSRAFAPSTGQRLQPASAMDAPASPATDTAARVAVRGVSRVFPGNVEAIRNLDLDIPAGEFVALLGPSGCGKSTLLRIIAGLDRPTAGTLAVNDERGARTAFVFQDAHLLPWRTVIDNVALPLELLGVISRAEARARALDAIAQVDLADAATRYPA